MAEKCQRNRDGIGMPAECIVVQIFNGKGDIRNCSSYRAVKLLENGKVVERLLEKKLCRIVCVDKMQFGFMPERGTVDAIIISRIQ